MECAVAKNSNLSNNKKRPYCGQKTYWNFFEQDIFVGLYFILGV